MTDLELKKRYFYTHMGCEVRYKGNDGPLNMYKAVSSIGDFDFIGTLIGIQKDEVILKDETGYVEYFPICKCVLRLKSSTTVSSYTYNGDFNLCPSSIDQHRMEGIAIPFMYNSVKELIHKDFLELRD